MQALYVTDIHPSAVIDPTAELGNDVRVDPFCVIEQGVRIGDGCQLANHCVVKQGTTLGKENSVGEGAVLGGRPQHLRAGDELGELHIGDGNTIREYATIHRALAPGSATQVGDHNLIMVGAHIAHDCRIGNHTILANGVLLAGHIEINDRAYLSGAVGMHQFCRVGRYAMVGGQAHIKHDVPPFVTVDGNSSHIVGLNKVGLRRNGFDRQAIDQLMDAYRLIYRSGLKWADLLTQLDAQFSDGPAAEFHAFFTGGSRGFIQERSAPRPATVSIQRTAPPEAPRLRRVG